VRRLAAGGGHSAVLTDACSLKELCEFKLAETVNLSNAELIEDVASRTGADALARLCEKLRYRTTHTELRQVVMVFVVLILYLLLVLWGLIPKLSKKKRHSFIGRTGFL